MRNVGQALACDGLRPICSGKRGQAGSSPPQAKARPARAELILLALAMPMAATIVDRIAVSVGTQVITDSEIEQRIRLTAFENSTFH